jgi:hypothetical protein
MMVFILYIFDVLIYIYIYIEKKARRRDIENDDKKVVITASDG